MQTADGHKVSCDAVVLATNSPINHNLAVHARQLPYRCGRGAAGRGGASAVQCSAPGGRRGRPAATRASGLQHARRQGLVGLEWLQFCSAPCCVPGPQELRCWAEDPKGQVQEGAVLGHGRRGASSHFCILHCTALHRQASNCAWDWAPLSTQAARQSCGQVHPSLLHTCSTLTLCFAAPCTCSLLQSPTTTCAWRSLMPTITC